MVNLGNSVYPSKLVLRKALKLLLILTPRLILFKYKVFNYPTQSIIVCEIIFDDVSKTILLLKILAGELKNFFVSFVDDTNPY